VRDDNEEANPVGRLVSLVLRECGLDVALAQMLRADEKGFTPAFLDLLPGSAFSER
jgi:hypothetical protein